MTEKARKTAEEVGSWLLLGIRDHPTVPRLNRAEPDRVCRHHQRPPVRQHLLQLRHGFENPRAVLKRNTTDVCAGHMVRPLQPSAALSPHRAYCYSTMPSGRQVATRSRHRNQPPIKLDAV
jgi:hypothetical protein